jgi:UDP-N-acetylmuramoyl-tripeptide--D-alanyl-D-alanine ligase
MPRPPAATNDTSSLWNGPDVLRLTGGRLLSGDPDWRASGVGYAPEAAGPGQLVLVTNPASWGRKFADTSTMIGAIADAGAAAVITETAPDEIPRGCPVLQVDDSRLALDALAAAARERLAGRLIAAVGDHARVFMRRALVGALGVHGEICMNRPGYCGARGIALSLANTPTGVAHTIFELAPRPTGIAQAVATLARPDVVVVTDVDPPRSRSATARAAAVLAGLETGGAVVVNAELPRADEVMLAAVEHGAARVVTYGSGPAADVRPVERITRGNMIDVHAAVAGTPVAFSVPAARPRHVLHVLGALATLAALGVDLARFGAGTTAAAKPPPPLPAAPGPETSPWNASASSATFE